MGTRSLTRIFDEQGIEVVCMYRQYDGYMSGHGQELADFLAPIRLVNGFGSDTTNLANGMGCLAGQIVAHFKKGCGEFYLHAPGTHDVGEEYVYEVRKHDGKIQLWCRDRAGTVLFQGTPADFKAADE